MYFIVYSFCFARPGMGRSLLVSRSRNRLFDIAVAKNIQGLKRRYRRRIADATPNGLFSTFPAITRQCPHDRASMIALKRDVVRVQERKPGQSNLEVSAIG
jgi:hypothetical protein